MNYSDKHLSIITCWALFYWLSIYQKADKMFVKLCFLLLIYSYTMF
jgi:hypothetical protein